MSDRTLIYLQFEVRDLDAEARVNDIPLARGHRGAHRVIGVPLAEYLLEGPNRLELILHDDAPPGAEALARVAAFAAGETLAREGGAPLARLAPALGPDAAAPLRIGAEFEPPRTALPSRPPAWALAARIDADAERAEAEAYALHLARLYEARDVAGLLAEFAPALETRLRAYPAVDPAMARAGFASQFETDGAWSPEPVSPGSPVLRPAADGRLLELTGPEGRPLLRTAPPRRAPGSTELPAFIGRLDGALRVLL